MRNEFVIGASDANTSGLSASTELLTGLVATSVGVLPASKGELGTVAKQLAAQNAILSNRLAQEEVINIRQETEIQQLIKQVDSLTPVRTLPIDVKFCAGFTQPRELSLLSCERAFGEHTCVQQGGFNGTNGSPGPTGATGDPGLQGRHFPWTRSFITMMFQLSTSTSVDNESAPPTIQNLVLPHTQTLGNAVLIRLSRAFLFASDASTCTE